MYKVIDTTREFKKFLETLSKICKDINKETIRSK